MSDRLIVKSSLSEKIVAATLVAILSVGGAAGYVYYDSTQKTKRLEEALQKSEAQFNALKEDYDRLVQRSAVTELRVSEGKLDVLVRKLDGTTQIIDTPYDPNGEIYIDYVVLDQRLLIRRVFDDNTAPKDALVIDDRLLTVNWDAKSARYGKAIYRKLDEGRWVITVTGNGSLGLTKLKDETVNPVQPPTIPEDNAHGNNIEGVE